MSNWVRNFFSDLDRKISSASSISDLRAFIRPFSEQFEALYTEAKSGVPRAQLKNAEAEIEALKEGLKTIQKEAQAQIDAQTHNYESNLETQAKAFQKEIARLAAENQALGERISVAANPKQSQQSDGELPDVAVEILKYIGQSEKWPGKAELKAKFSLAEVTLQHFMDVLSARKMVLEPELWSLVEDGEPSWGIDKAGRAYLVEHDLIEKVAVPVDRSERLTDIPERVLQCVRIGSVLKLAKDIAAEVGLAQRVDLAESHLHLLLSLRYVVKTEGFVETEGSTELWSRTPEGNAYLAKYDLLK